MRREDFGLASELGLAALSEQALNGETPLARKLALSLILNELKQARHSADCAREQLQLLQAEVMGDEMPALKVVKP